MPLFLLLLSCCCSNKFYLLSSAEYTENNRYCAFMLKPWLVSASYLLVCSCFDLVCNNSFKNNFKFYDCVQLISNKYFQCKALNNISISLILVQKSVLSLRIFILTVGFLLIFICIDFLCIYLSAHFFKYKHTYISICISLFRYRLLGR